MYHIVIFIQIKNHCNRTALLLYLNVVWCDTGRHVFPCWHVFSCWQLFSCWPIFSCWHKFYVRTFCRVSMCWHVLSHVIVVARGTCCTSARVGTRHVLHISTCCTSASVGTRHVLAHCICCKSARVGTW